MLRGVKWLLEHAAAALLLDPGLGKTSIVLAALKILIKEGAASRIIIVAPLRVCYLVWPKEIEKWADFNRIKYAVLHGDGKDAEALAREDVNIFIINPEGLAWLLNPSNTKLWRLLNPDTLVIDESSKFKNTQSRRFKFLKPFLKRFQRRWILTGSPAPNGLRNLFGQVYILDLGRAFGQYISHYDSKYFRVDTRGFGNYKKIIKDGADKEIYKLIKPLALRMKAEDYMELPELVQFDITVELPPKARIAYEEMENEMFTILDSHDELFAVNAAAASVKCEQMANGAIYKNRAIDEPKPSVKAGFVELHEAKIEALKDFLEERESKPTLITYQFRHDLERLLKALGKNTPVMGGGMSMKRTAEIERSWNAGEIEWMLAQPASMGHGLNLQESGDCIVWFSPIWDWEIYDQTIRRLRRQGSVNSRILCAHIIARNTVDRAKMISISRKRKVERAFLNAMNTYRKEKRAA